MTVLLQRCQNANVSVDGNTVGQINFGLTLFVGVFEGDSETECDFLARKIAALRIFCDQEGKMNRSVLDVGGSVLSISNFTLCANARKGNRPSYDGACNPARANELYKYFTQKLCENGIQKVEMGVFGADMKVSVENDGPVSIILDTDKIMPKK